MDAQAFSQQYLSLQEPLYRVALYILESDADAQDAVQDLYARLWLSRDTLDAVHNPKAYCITMVRNICMDRVRKNSRHQSRQLEEDMVAVGAAVDAIAGKEQLARVMKAVEALPESQRNILKMRVFEELSYEEIAERTGMGYLTLRVLLSQARRTLRRLV